MLETAKRSYYLRKTFYLYPLATLFERKTKRSEYHTKCCQFFTKLLLYATYMRSQKICEFLQEKYYKVIMYRDKPNVTYPLDLNHEGLSHLLPSQNNALYSVQEHFPSKSFLWRASRKGHPYLILHYLTFS